MQIRISPRKKKETKKMGEVSAHLSKGIPWRKGGDFTPVFPGGG